MGIALDLLSCTRARDLVLSVKILYEPVSPVDGAQRTPLFVISLQIASRAVTAAGSSASARSQDAFGYKTSRGRDAT
jgi:hypothetical protein